MLLPLSFTEGETLGMRRDEDRIFHNIFLKKIYCKKNSWQGNYQIFILTFFSWIKVVLFSCSYHPIRHFYWRPDIVRIVTVYESDLTCISEKHTIARWKRWCNWTVACNRTPVILRHLHQPITLRTYK